MDAKTTAIVLIGYQNDYFSNNGVLHAVVGDTARSIGVLPNTIDMLERLQHTDAMLVTTPIIFTSNYEELIDPVGILKAVKEAGAFKKGTKGAENIPEILQFGKRIANVPGKRGLNAFTDTRLEAIFKKRGIKDVVIAGAVTSICIDSTARAAFEKGFRVTILADCTCGRTILEQEFYCEKVFPLYASVMDHNQLLEQLG